MYIYAYDDVTRLYDVTHTHTHTSMHVDMLMCIHAYACVYAYAYTYMHAYHSGKDGRNEVKAHGIDFNFARHVIKRFIKGKRPCFFLKKHGHFSIRTANDFHLDATHSQKSVP